MALITCPDCGKQFSDKAPACPQCGCPPIKTISCEDCGQPIPETSEACPNCGAPNPQPVPAQPIPQPLTSPQTTPASMPQNASNLPQNTSNLTIKMPTPPSLFQAPKRHITFLVNQKEVGSFGLNEFSDLQPKTLSTPITPPGVVTIKLDFGFFKKFNYTIPSDGGNYILVYELGKVQIKKDDTIVLHDTANFGLQILCILIPIVGIILGIKNSSSKPITSKACFFNAIWGMLIDIPILLDVIFRVLKHI